MIIGQAVLFPELEPSVLAFTPRIMSQVPSSILAMPDVEIEDRMLLQVVYGSDRESEAMLKYLRPR